MRGTYNASFRAANETASGTLLYLQAPSNKVVEIFSASVTNESNTTNQQLVVGIQRISVLGTPTAVTITPAPTEQGDQASTCTVKANVTASEPTYPPAGTGADIPGFGLEGFSTLAGWYYDPLPEERLVVPPTGAIGIRLLKNATAFDAVVRLTYREIG